MATITYRGDAVAFAQVDSTTITSGWATDDTANVTINGKTLAVTIGAAVTVTDIAEAVVAAFNGAAVVGSETRNFIGSDVEEFDAITASNAAGVLTFTGDDEGTPFTLTVSETTAGAGTMGTPSTTTTAGGANALVAANVSGGTLPGAADTFIYEDSDSDCLFNLSALSGTLASVQLKGNYTGLLGLPRTNEGGGYVEYLGRELVVDASEVIIGAGDGNGSGRIVLNNGTVQTAVTIYNSGSSVDTGVHAVRSRGTHVSNTMNVAGGASVDIAAAAGETATVATLSATDGAVLRTSTGTTLTTVNVDGAATIEIHSATGLADITTLDIAGSGTVILYGDNDVTTVNITGDATLDDRGSGTITNLNRGPRGNYTTADSAVADGARVVTNATFEGGSGEVNDVQKKVTWSNAIDFGLSNPMTDFDNMDLGDNIDLAVS